MPHVCFILGYVKFSGKVSSKSYQKAKDKDGERTAGTYREFIVHISYSQI